ncbi:Secreted protein [Phytophthora cinnamomi]|uniref:Secreted protein n=1 Tax=Phytophthora cinnamomi TaxID=4785 RepID=UPI00355A98AB|nr:Secreted protein [Phytophthora cinnamomi]
MRQKRARTRRRRPSDRLPLQLKPVTRDTARDSDSNLEEKAAPPLSKKTWKAAAPRASAAAEPKRPAAPRSDQGFDLTTFMASYQPGRSGVADAPSRPDRDTPTASSCPDMTAELQALREEVRRLRGLVAAQDPTARGFVSPGATTEPNTRRELPPLELRQFTTASFPEWTKKAKGDYNPPQAHL